MLAGLLALAAALWLFGICDPALARDGTIEVDVELVLAVDISYSMDPEEQALQRQGYVEALNSPVILDAIKKGVNGKIAVTYVEWAGSATQESRRLDDHRRPGERRRNSPTACRPRRSRRLYRTSISGALDFAVQLFETTTIAGLEARDRRFGRRLQQPGTPGDAGARDDALAQGITINGLPLMLNRPNFGYPEVEHARPLLHATASSAALPPS